MFCGGDELFRTQFGNNNAFNLDTNANWLDYAAGAAFPDQRTYVQRLLAFRQAHDCLRPAGFFQGVDHNGNGLKDLTWYQDDGREVSQEYFSNPANHFLAFRIDGTEFGDVSPSIMVMYNGHSGDISAVLPPNLPGRRWFVAGDTAHLGANQYFLAEGNELIVFPPNYLCAARSIAVLIEK